jgi:putative peptidoglycan lipid II flippase
MLVKRILAIKSLIDFIYLFLSNIVIKGFGFVREIILAYFFGTSLLYSFYILLRTAADFMSQFTFGNALQSNILPKLSKHFQQHDKVSYNKLFAFTRGSFLFIFIISQIIQSVIIWSLDSEYTVQLIGISLLLSVLISLNFFNSIFMTVLQAEGKFKDYSLASTLNLFTSSLVLYPLALFFDIFGAVISRIIGVLALIKQYIIPVLQREKSNEVEISIRDFSLSVLLLGNFPSIILLSSRFVAGTDGDNNIAYFNYAMVLLNVVLTAVIANINTIMLRRLSIKKELKWLFSSLLIAFGFGAALYFFSENYSTFLIESFFHRGKFTVTDIQQTASYFKQMSLAIVILLISSVLSQPYFTLDIGVRNQYSKYLSGTILLSFILILFMLYFNDWDARTRSLIMLYTMSVLSLIISMFTCVKYFKHES